MKTVDIPFTEHPSFIGLKTVLNEIAARKSRSFRIIELGGIPFALEEFFMNELSAGLGFSLIYSERDAQEVRRYFDTLQILDLTKISSAELKQILINHNFNHVTKVGQRGEFAITGDLMSFWPIGYEHPLRVSYFGDKFEFAEVYDEIYGRSYQKLQDAAIGDVAKIENEISVAHIRVKISENNFLAAAVIFGGDTLDEIESKFDLTFDFVYPKLFFQRFDILQTELKKFAEEGYKIKLFTKHKDAIPPELIKYVSPPELDLEAGVQSKQLKLFYLTDRELFGTVFLNRAAKKLTSTEARRLLAQLEGEIEIDDPVVHEDYGIGIYKGIKQEQFKQEIPLGFNEFRTRMVYEDYLLIAYAAGDELYVPLSQIDKITKYIAVDDEDPEITRLGKSDWNKLKTKVKASVARLAQELVEHYAKQQMSRAKAVPNESSADFEHFLDTFPYTETPDQLTTEKAVYKDLAMEKPMNRLVVGDVGFGKTEIAMRAAFRVAEAGMQVAVLCPTTVLAAQHLKVFTDRFGKSKFEVASLSRFSKHANKDTVAKLATGEVQIVIGTHRLLSSDIVFKKLGLVIIDEEQKFGVKQKEKLKQIEYGTHVLTLSATPIPRTLSMALSAIQDISIIQTPPEGRKNVKTTVQRQDQQKILDAIMFEVNRNGQVYYLHNRVGSIASVFRKLQLLLPGVRFIYAHGQMPPEQLEKTMSDFYADKYDVLICTTIIENGLDMPNVNTIIIEAAQNYGLGQLYQLRGRVGRSERQAYAYLFYEGEDIDKKKEETEIPQDEKILKQKAQHQKYKQRLQAIVQLQELGSGFSLASRDLEIRGAGNLLGKEQHGNIRNIGYGLYMQLLANEIERLKHLSKEYTLKE